MGLAHVIRFLVQFVDLSNNMKTREIFLEHRVPQLGETIRFNNSNMRHRVVGIENVLMVPVEDTKYGPTLGFYDRFVIEIEEA